MDKEIWGLRPQVGLSPRTDVGNLEQEASKLYSL